MGPTLRSGVPSGSWCRKRHQLWTRLMAAPAIATAKGLHKKSIALALITSIEHYFSVSLRRKYEKWNY